MTCDLTQVCIHLPVQIVTLAIATASSAVAEEGDGSVGGVCYLMKYYELREEMGGGGGVLHKT